MERAVSYRAARVMSEAENLLVLADMSADGARHLLQSPYITQALQLSSELCFA